MSDTRLEEYHEQAEVLRYKVAAAHEEYLIAASEYDFHRRRLTALYSGAGAKLYLDGHLLEAEG